MYASKDVLALASLKVDLSSIETGSTVTVKWREKAVFTRRCTKDDIKLASSLLLVSVPILVASLCLMDGDFGGSFCPCHGSHYVISSRIREGLASKNLEYMFTIFWRIRNSLYF
ncbi:hypothetical protein MKW92_046108 [Papaver armeniacum]|nr:hypothetical protein MKW92_046108 [Papaver armeniacum]